MNKVASIFVSKYCPYESIEHMSLRCSDVLAIDFYAANQIVLTLIDYQQNSLDESEAELVFHILMMLFYLQRHGSSCLHLSSIEDAVMWRQFDTNEQLTHAGYPFPEKEKMHQVLKRFFAKTPSLASLVYKDYCLYTSRYYEYEKSIVKRIHDTYANSRFEQQNTQQLSDNLSLFWAQLFQHEKHNITIQQRAILNAIFSDFSVITGGAGTGKTYTVARLLLCILSLYTIRPSEILLIAPTGKAANRLQESLNDELDELQKLGIEPSLLGTLRLANPQTVHKAIGINPVTSKSAFNEGNKLPVKLVIIDEMSMLDIATMAKLIAAIPLMSKLVLIGDPYQLPSVNIGSLLAELITCFNEVAPSKTHTFSTYVSFIENERKKSITENQCLKTTLLTNFRSKTNLSKIAQSVLNADISAISSQQSDNFRITPINESVSASENTNAIIKKWIVPRYQRIQDSENITLAWEYLKDYVFLSPYRNGALGVDAINQKVHSLLNGHDSLDLFSRGTPIIIGQNDYRQSLFNGDVGLIWPDNSGELHAWFKMAGKVERSNQETYRVLPLQTLPKCSMAYALTIHKTQGSEYRSVDILLAKNDENFLSNELVYTAVTRAKEQVNIFTSLDILRAAINKRIMRTSGIQRQLIRSR